MCFCLCHLNALDQVPCSNTFNAVNIYIKKRYFCGILLNILGRKKDTENE